jgi:hypothetical protein
LTRQQRRADTYYLTTQGKPAAFNGKPAKLITDVSVPNFDKF